jgi:single-stranded-DNA-specific exonuclease
VAEHGDSDAPDNGASPHGQRLQAAQAWQAAPYSFAEAHALSRELGLRLSTASVLARRGLGDPAAARRFLDATETHDPSQFRGMDEAVDLLARHLGGDALIAVHGDYDVDGICSTALAVRTLRTLGATVRPVLPSRMDDGYGLSADTVTRLHGQGVSLLVTVDCGITAVEEAAHARRLGMDVLVTDHHRPGAALPDCPIVHPVLGDYPCQDLCATGVVYKLCQALCRACGRDPAELEEDLDLVALATVADVVPLLGENRTLVKRGLRTLAGTGKVGLRALMKVARVEPQAVAEHSLGFVLGPRLNAAGRLYRADAPLELLLTEDEGRALEVARELDAINTERQAVETRILFEAEAELSAEPGRKEEPLYVLAGEGWHPGVIGIVASRLVERYHRPCVLIALDEHGRGRGSGRSISAYDLHGGLGACSSHLVRFGGHRMAAGLELERSALESFRAALTDHARASLRSEELVRVDRVDLVASGADVGLGLAEEIDLLRPFGMGNPTVNILLPAARLSEMRAMGEGRHASFTVTSAGVRTRAVAFGTGGRPVPASVDGAEPRHDLIARLEANEWRGTIEPRLVMRSVHALSAPEDTCEEPEAAGCAGCACRARGADWWEAVWREFDAPLDSTEHLGSAAPSRTIVDLRAQGALTSLTELLSTKESVAVVCADVSRRRALLGRELAPERFGRQPASLLSSRCAGFSQAPSISAGDRAFWLLDYASVARWPELLQSFTHLFALDPPPFRRLSTLLERSGAPDRATFLHLGWGEAEVDLAQKALEQEYGLQASLRAIYGALARSSEPLAGSALERALAGGGRHPRSPILAARCLRVLVELGVAELERSSATVSCTIISKRRVELERSQAFCAYVGLYREGQRFLSEAAQMSSRAKAA